MFRNLITVLIVFVASTLASYGMVMAQAGQPAPEKAAPGADDPGAAPATPAPANGAKAPATATDTADGEPA